MADEFDPDKITNLSQVRERRDLEEKYVDFMSSLREGVGKRKELGDAHSWKYEIGDRVVTRHTGKLPNPTPWKITGRVIREKGLLEGSRPREGKNITGPDVPYYTVSRLEDIGTPEEGEVFSSLPEWSIQSKFGLEGLVPDEPRPKDQPRAPLLLEGPSEDKTGKEPSKGRMFRGIGSLMRGRMFPIIRAAQAGWETLSPEARAEIEDYLKRPAHELFGMDKPGIEYFKEWFGISPEKIDAYHGTTAEFDAFEFLHGSGGDLGFHFGTSEQAKDRLKETTQYSTPEKRAKGKVLSTELTLGKTLKTPDMPSFEEWNSPRSVAELLLGTRWGKTRKKDLKRILSEANVLNKSLDDRFETAIARDETLEWNPEFNRQLDRMDVQGRMHLLAELRNLLESDGYEGIKYVNKYEDPESRSYSYVVFDPANVRIKDKAKWSQNKAAGGFIDKPLYDDRRMIG